MKLYRGVNRLKTDEMDSTKDSIIDKLINGQRTDALEQFKELNPLQAGYIAVSIIEHASIDQASKNWFMNAMYNG